MLGGIIEGFEDLRHLPSGPEVHPEARHGTAGRQTDHTEHTHVFLLILINGRGTELTLCASGCIWFDDRGSMFLPEASRVERLSALQTSRQVLKVIREFLVLPELNHIVEVLHMLDDCVQLENRQRSGVSTLFKITVRAGTSDRWGL